MQPTRYKIQNSEKNDNSYSKNYSADTGEEGKDGKINFLLGH